MLFSKIHNFFPFFNRFIAPMFGLMFAAGDVALGGGGDSSAAISEAITALEGGGAEGEPQKDAVQPDNGEGGAEGDHTEEEKAAAAQSAREAKFPKLSKPLAAATMKFLREAKEANPQAYKEIMARVWEHENGSKKLTEHFPEGIDSAIELKQNMDAQQQLLRGHDLRTVQEAMNEIAEYRGIDQKIIKGDASFMRDLPENIADGLANAMPDIIGNWADRAPEAYQKYFAQVFTKTMIGSEEYYDLKAADRAMGRMDLTTDPELKAAHDAVKGILKLVDGISQTAQKKLEPKAKTAPPDSELQQREATVRQKELKGHSDAVSSSTIQHIGPTVKEVLINKAGKDYATKVNVRELVIKTLQNIDAAMGKEYSDALQQFIEAGDIEGAGRYVRQKLNHGAVTKATEQAFRYLYSGAKFGDGNPAPKPDKDQKLNRQTDTTPPGPYKLQRMRPATHKIDTAATKAAAKKEGITYAEFIMSRRAILTGGAKVSWPADAERED